MPKFPHLFGVPGAEHLYRDPETVYETEIEPEDPQPGEVALIEEWSVRPSEMMLPSVQNIIEYIIEMSDEVDEGWIEECERVGVQPDVVEAFTKARYLMASRIEYWMAYKLVETHEVTWPTPDTPHLDGKPMYHKRVGVDNA